MYVNGRRWKAPHETAMEMITLLEEELSENEDLILPARSYGKSWKMTEMEK